MLQSHRNFLPSMLLCVAVILFACTPASDTPPSDKLKIVATTTIVGDVVNQVVGDQMIVSVLLPAGTDPHAFEPQPKDIALIADADLIFSSGAGLETFLSAMLTNAGSEASIIDLSEGIEFRNLSTTDSDEHSDEPTDESSRNLDPHTWHNPQNVVIWVNHISKALIEMDPDHTDQYQENARVYIQELIDLDAWIASEVEIIPPENRLLVMDHETLGYFADRYNFQIVSAVFPGFSTLAAPSARELSGLEDQIWQLGVKAIFTGNTVNADLSEQIAQDTGTRLVFIFTDALTTEDGPAATYIQLMEYNARVIVEALK